MNKKMSNKGNAKKVNAAMAMKALQLAGGDRKAAYSQCVRLSWQTAGKLDAGFTNYDLQAFYDLYLER